MFRGFCILAVGVISGCSPQKSQQPDEDVALLRESLPGINQECIDISRTEGVTAIPQNVRECFPMEESKRWSGLWLDEMESSRFCPEPADECTSHSEGERIWLSFADDIREESRPNRYSTEVLYEIEFVGSLTSMSGAFGHEGGSDREIVVERLVRLEPVSES